MNRLIIITILVFAIQLEAKAWPNNLIFTLKPENVEILEEVETDIPVFKEKDGFTYIGKFAHPDIAELAQGQLLQKGVHTELLAFFRARPLDLADARTLLNNMARDRSSVLAKMTKTKTSDTCLWSS